MPTRLFSSQLSDDSSAGRTVDNDAPLPFRMELIDAVFSLETYTTVPESQLYRTLVLSMGIDDAPGNPYSGFRDGTARQIKRLSWERVYDLICRWWLEFPEDFKSDYVKAVNKVLSAYRIAWELRDDGRLHRVLPIAIAAQIQTAFHELSQPRFTSALRSFQEGMDAYEARPQRGRDACKNIFDSLESVAKEVYGMSAGTFGNVLNEARRQQSLSSETISVLQKLYDMANNHFRHGMTTPFVLRSAEIDFVLVSCMAGILLFVRV
jgi:hypothetical protein